MGHRMFEYMAMMVAVVLIGSSAVGYVKAEMEKVSQDTLKAMLEVTE